MNEDKDTCPLEYGPYRGSTPEEIADEFPNYIILELYPRGECSIGLYNYAKRVLRNK